jgi:hypothetical protein
MLDCLFCVVVESFLSVVEFTRLMLSVMGLGLVVT